MVKIIASVNNKRRVPRNTVNAQFRQEAILNSPSLWEGLGEGFCERVGRVNRVNGVNKKTLMTLAPLMTLETLLTPDDPSSFPFP